MPSTILCFRVGVVLISLAPPTMSFSRGASHASCRGMIPGHIHAQPQDPKHSYVTVRTSASSYLPGQFVTVTVRSSRDFMGFLLQARRVEEARGEAAGGAGVGTGVGTGGGSMRAGPAQVGGSWTLTPPGTNTLRCLSEGDTVTHSDKQLKRNLSFVWRAPDAPMGNVRFYITVVKSYFVYWAGIESAVVHDGSRSPRRGSNSTEEHEAREIFALQKDKVTASPALEAQRTSNQQPNETATSATTVGNSTRTSSGTKLYQSLKTPKEVTRPTLETNTSEASASLGVHHLKNQPVGKRSTWSWRFLQNDTHSTPGSVSGATKEAGTKTFTHAEDLKSSPPLTTSFSTVEVEGMDAPTSVLPNISSSSPSRPPASFFPLDDVDTESKDPKINLQDPKPKTTTTAIPSTNHSFHNTTPTSQNPGEPIQSESSGKLETQSGSAQSQRTDLTEPQTSTIKAGIHGRSQNPHSETSSPKPLVQFQTSGLYLRSQTGTSRTHQFPNPQSPSSFHQTRPETAPTPPQARASFPQTDRYQSQRPPDASATSADPRYQDRKLTPSSVTPRPFTLLLKTTSPIFTFVPSATPPLPPPPPFSTSTSSSPPDTSPSSSSVHRPATTPLHPSVGSNPASTHPSVRSTLLMHFSSSSKTNQPQTAPSLSALPSPSPISTPPRSLPTSFDSSTMPSLSFSISPTPAPRFTPIPSSTSSQCLTNSTTSPPLSSSSTSASSTSISIPTSSSSFAVFSSSSPVTSSSSSQSTSALRGPSPAPRRSLLDPLASSSSPVLSQKLTVGQRLLVQNRVASSNRNPPTPRTVVHPNLNLGHELKPNLPNSNPVRPSDPSGPPDKEGKRPDLIPRHSSWELGMLLGCSAGLGMVLVVGVRYVYRQACGRQTGVTLNDREREYGRGERGLIHVQECGDLVRVRKIRENSFVLLAEYDILTSPGE